MRLARTLFVVVFGFLLILAGLTTCRAHDFYDPWCCNDKDCAPAAAGSVSWTPQGWSVPRLQTVVPFDDTRIRHNPSDVPGFSICEYPKGNLRCLYVPEPQG